MFHNNAIFFMFVRFGAIFTVISIFKKFLYALFLLGIAVRGVRDIPSRTLASVVQDMKRI